MHCNEVRQLVDFPEFITPRSRVIHAEHLRQCEDCRNYNDQHDRFVRLLSSLPVREPGSALESSLSTVAHSKRIAAGNGLHLRWALATAASVILTVFLTVQYYPSISGNTADAGATDTVASLMPQQSRTIDILLDSPRSLEGALITVHLGSDVELVGYEGLRDLQWSTNLKAGANRLSLPVHLLTGETGEITVIVEHGGSSKQLSVIVNAESATRENKPIVI